MSCRRLQMHFFNVALRDSRCLVIPPNFRLEHPRVVVERPLTRHHLLLLAFSKKKKAPLLEVRADTAFCRSMSPSRVIVLVFGNRTRDEKFWQNLSIVGAAAPRIGTHFEKSLPALKLLVCHTTHGLSVHLHDMVQVLVRQSTLI